MKTLTFKIGGIHPPQDKTAPADRIITVELPRKVAMPMQMHIGAPAKPIVAKGDHVERGQMIAEAGGKISAPVHASISGTVSAVGPVTLAQGRSVNAVHITATDQDHANDMARIQAKPNSKPWKEISRTDLLSAIANAGVVGLGGATFPTAVKLNAPSTPEYLIINACECEPRLTCDDATMRAYPGQIVEGTLIMMAASGAPKAIIGIENNKMEAFEKLVNASKGHPEIEVQLLKARYPQGCEKQLIYALLKREIPSGQLPISVGCVVQNVGTAYAVYQAVALGQPLIERVITIDGCGNYLVPVGMTLSELPVEGYVTVAEADVVAGGPMMGQSTVTMDAPVVKGLSGISVITPPLSFNPDPCIRCAACAEACPMGLEPFMISTLSRLGKIEEALANNLMDCIECGSCSYSCPSARPLVDFIRYGKGKARALAQAKKK